MSIQIKYCTLHRHQKWLKKTTRDNNYNNIFIFLMSTKDLSWYFVISLWSVFITEAALRVEH